MGSTTLDLDDLDEEELQALKEVSRKGYYHGRPKSQCEPASAPQCIDRASGSQDPPPGVAKRTEFDAYQQKWDRFGDDAFVQTLEEPAPSPRGPLVSFGPDPTNPPTVAESRPQSREAGHGPRLPPADRVIEEVSPPTDEEHAASGADASEAVATPSGAAAPSPPQESEETEEEAGPAPQEEPSAPRVATSRAAEGGLAAADASVPVAVSSGAEPLSPQQEGEEDAAPTLPSMHPGSSFVPPGTWEPDVPIGVQEPGSGAAASSQDFIRDFLAALAQSGQGFAEASNAETPRKRTSRAELNALPDIKVTALDIVANESPECVICLLEFVLGEPATRLPCGHLFHETCIKEWLRTRSNECPVCRYELQTDNVEEERSRRQRMALRKPRLRFIDLSVKSANELRGLAKHLGVDVRGCLEKQELVDCIANSGKVEIMQEDSSGSTAVAPPVLTMTHSQVEAMGVLEIQNILKRLGICVDASADLDELMATLLSCGRFALAEDAPCHNCLAQDAPAEGWHSAHADGAVTDASGGTADASAPTATPEDVVMQYTGVMQDLEDGPASDGQIEAMDARLSSLESGLAQLGSEGGGSCPAATNAAPSQAVMREDGPVSEAGMSASGEARVQIEAMDARLSSLESGLAQLGSEGGGSCPAATNAAPSQAVMREDGPVSEAGMSASGEARGQIEVMEPRIARLESELARLEEAKNEKPKRPCSCTVQSCTVQ